jgi:zinc finger-containing ubiquitin peptidase 1
MNCDNEKENGVNVNGVSQNHGEGSPLRSQLGLKLKTNNKPKITIPAIPSPLMCLMCPYTTKDPRTLEEHINRSHFDPISPGVNAGAHGGGTSNHVDTLDAFQCPICVRCFETCGDLELHVNHEHSDILSPAKVDTTTAYATAALTNGDEATCNLCPVCGISLATMKTQEMELHIESHFTKSPVVAVAPDLEKEAQKLREQREFEMLRAQYVSRAIYGSCGRFKNSFSSSREWTIRAISENSRLSPCNEQSTLEKCRSRIIIVVK